jgi:hypothetical protein
MRKLIALLALLAGTAFADEGVRKVLEVKYVSLGQVENLAKTFGVASTRIGNSVAVSGSSGAVEAVEFALKKVDVPPVDVELTGYMVAASKQSAQGGDLPEVLAPVVQQLRGLLAYKDFRLIDTLRLRANCDGSRAVNDGGTPDGFAYSFSIGALRCAASKDEPIHVEALWLSIGKPGSAGVRLSSNVDINEGQQVVVGKAGFADGALILVVSARRMQ